jgi:hypothetical protein
MRTESSRGPEEGSNDWDFSVMSGNELLAMIAGGTDARASGAMSVSVFGFRECVTFA